MSSKRQSRSGSFREPIDKLVPRVGGKERRPRHLEQSRREGKKKHFSPAFLLNEGLFRSSQARE